jgi:hypothetical protein
MVLMQELVKEALEALAMAGYDRPHTMEPLLRDELLGGTGDNIIGCKVAAKDVDGRVAHEDVYYPKNWFERVKDRSDS